MASASLAYDPRNFARAAPRLRESQSLRVRFGGRSEGHAENADERSRSANHERASRVTIGRRRLSDSGIVDSLSAWCRTASKARIDLAKPVV